MTAAILGHAGHAVSIAHAHPEILIALAIVALVGLTYRALREGARTP